MEATTRLLTQARLDQLTRARAEQAQQQALAVFVLGGLGVYLSVRVLEVVFGRLAVGAKVVRQGMERAAQGIAENTARGQLPPRIA